MDRKRQGGCGQPMLLKETKDSKDLLMWRCRRILTVTKSKMTYKVKDVKVSIRHNSWLVDAKIKLETVLELGVDHMLGLEPCGKLQDSLSRHASN